MSEIVTSCKDCYFARYSKNTQIGCKLNYLKKFPKVQSAYDEEKEFFIIPGVACDHKRTFEWSIDKEDPIKAVKEEVMLTYDAFILITCNPTKIIHDLVNQTIKPKSIIGIVSPTYDYSSADFYSIESEGICKVLQILADDEPELSRQDVDLYIQSHEKLSQWYLITESGKKLKHNYIEEINHKIYEDKVQAAVVEPISGNPHHGLFVLRHIRNLVGDSLNIENLVGDLCLKNVV